MHDEGKNRAARRAEAKAAPKGLVAHVRYRVSRELVLGSDDPLGVVMLHIDEGLRELITQGGDPLEHGVITIGRHPSHPDDVTIEIKTDRKGGPLLVVTAGADDTDDVVELDDETESAARALYIADCGEIDAPIDYPEWEDLTDEQRAAWRKAFK